jgi:hypothetical protein
MEKYSFQKGYNKIQKGRVPTVRKAIMEALGFISLPAFYDRLRGDVEPKVSEAKAIEDIFAKEKIKDIWGE